MNVLMIKNSWALVLIPVTRTRATTYGLMNDAPHDSRDTFHTDSDMKSTPEVRQRSSPERDSMWPPLVCLSHSWARADKGLGPEKGEKALPLAVDRACEIHKQRLASEARVQSLRIDVDTLPLNACVNTLAFEQFKLQELCTARGIKKEAAFCSVITFHWISKVTWPSSEALGHQEHCVSPQLAHRPAEIASAGLRGVRSERVKKELCEIKSLSH